MKPNIFFSVLIICLIVCGFMLVACENPVQGNGKNGKDSDSYVAVDTIIGVTTMTLAGMPMPLSGIAEPLNATNRNILWSVKDTGNTGAEISGTTLNTRAAGTAIITATIENGRSAHEAYTQDFNISVLSFFVWKGELESAPDDPEQNWAYLNSGDKTAYIWNGSAWEQLSVVGEGLPDKDGIIVEISDDGYLVVNGEKTGVKMQSESGGSGVILQYYTVHYDANGGSGAMGNSSFAIGFWEKLEKNSFTKAGSVFSGWSATPDGQPEYADEGFVKNLSAVQNGSITLYAMWGAQNTYTVSYTANGGEGLMPPSVFMLGQIYTLSLNTFTRTGYTFEGWATEPSGTVGFTDGQIVGYLTTTAGATVHLYAVWKAITYTVVYNANGGSGTMADSIFTYDEPQTLRANSFTRSGYPFTGWATSPGGQAEYADGEDFQCHVPPAGGTRTLYAVWILAGFYTITFDPNNGSPYTSETIGWGDPVAKPADPVKAIVPTVPGLYSGTAPDYRYFFNGWYDGGTKWDFDNPVTDDITLTAQWSEAPFDLSSVNAETGNTIVDKAFAFINANPGEYTLLIGEDIAITGDSRGLNQSNTQLMLLGQGTERKISLTSPGSMFYVGAYEQTGISLTLGENITLIGHSSNNTSVVGVIEGALIMQDNASVSGNNGRCGVSVGFNGSFTMQDYASVYGNTGYNSSAGGVIVSDGGSFTMQDYASVYGNTGYNNSAGGVSVGNMFMHNGHFTMQGNSSVSGNTSYASSGGGVFVGSSSIFTIRENAAVSGNTIENYEGYSGSGGGVYVEYYGIFRIAGGTVYGNDAGPLSNTISGSGTGAALYRGSNGTAQYGTFDGTNWGFLSNIPLTPNGSNFYRDTTIKALNGNLVAYP